MSIDAPEPSEDRELPNVEPEPGADPEGLPDVADKEVPEEVVAALQGAVEATHAAAETLVNVAAENGESSDSEVGINERVGQLQGAQYERIRDYLELDKPGEALVDVARAEVAARLEGRAARFAESIAEAMESVPDAVGEVDPTGKASSKNSVEVWSEAGNVADYLDKPSEDPLAQLQSLEEAAQMIRAMTGVEPADDFNPHRAQERISELTKALDDPPGAAVVDLGLDRSLVLRWGDSAEIDLHVEVVRGQRLLSNERINRETRRDRWVSRSSRFA